MSPSTSWRRRFRGWRVGVRFRIVNRLRDTRDRWIHGLCCAAPEHMNISGAYHFWRCSRPRGHKGPHRSVNYLWGHEGGGYSPLDHPPRMLDRYPVLTRRQRRERKAWEQQCQIDRRMASG